MTRRLLHRRWTAEEDEVLSRLWLSGSPVVRIARKMGRGQSSIYVRAGALGLPTKPSLKRCSPVAQKALDISPPSGSTHL